MGWLSGQLIDIIEWLDDGQETMVYRFERHNNEIKNGAKLVVRPGQAAIFVNEGSTSVADVFEPGTHELTTANLPILSTLMGWKHGFESPFKAEVYFVKTSKFTDLKWGTRGPVTVECEGYGMFDLRANGTYVIQIGDPKKFLEEIVGTDGKFDVADISNDLRDEIVMNVSDRLGELELNPGKLTGQMKDISEELQAPIQEYLGTLGLELTRFRVASLTMPDDVRKELMEMSRLSATKLSQGNPQAMQNLTALRASRAMGDMANNPGGTGAAGAGMEMAMGVMMANQMGGALAAGAQPQQQQASPPLPGAGAAAASTEYKVGIDNQQYGPYPMNRLKSMAADGSFKPAMLVWAAGMAGWAKAADVPELAALFGAPPLPGAGEAPPLPSDEPPPLPLPNLPASMPITINRDGENFGPYTPEEVRDLLANGTLKEDDLAHEEGADDWIPLRGLTSLQTGATTQAQASRGKEGGPTTFPCTGCGGDLVYSPGVAKMECPYCGAEVDCPVPTGEVLEHDFESQLASLESGAPTTTVAEATCEACGAENQLDANQTSGDCAFCGTPFVQQPKATNIMRPQAVLPFAVTREEGIGHFREWINGLWFAPNKLKQFARDVQKLKGLYIPHWTYDSKTTTDYMGQRGEHYYVTEHYTDSEGRRQTRQVRRTHWYPAAGRVWVSFDDLLVPASDTLPRKYLDELEPWDLPALTPYEDAYLSGFQSESYTVGLRTGFDIAKGKMEPDIDQHIRYDIGGDEQRIHHKTTYYSDITFKYILLPVWISAYRFKDKNFQFLVNARTGEVQGERPWSWIKITLAILAGIALIGTIYYFTSQK